MKKASAPITRTLIPAGGEMKTIEMIPIAINTTDSRRYTLSQDQAGNQLQAIMPGFASGCFCGGHSAGEPYGGRLVPIVMLARRLILILLLRDIHF
jgi:hypothetical protein